MRFFLDTLVGDGTFTDDSENPFRAAHADGAHGILNLRPAPFCLVGAEALVGTPVLDFGDTLDDTPPMPLRQAWANRLGISFDQVTLRGIIAEIMLFHGKEDGSRWRNVKQNRAGNHKIWLGQGSLVYDAPVIQGTTLQDDFTETSDTNIDEHTATGPNSGFSWAYGTGAGSDLEVRESIDRVQADTIIANRTARAESDLATDDHFCQVEVRRWATSTTKACGPVVRFTSGADTSYLLHLRDRSDDQYRLFEVTTGSRTLIDSAVSEALPAEPVTAYLEIDGSSLDGKMDGVSKITGTDTVHSGQLRAGLHMGDSSILEDWKAEDLSAVTTRFIRSRLQSRKGLEFDADRLVSTGLISAGKST